MSQSTKPEEEPKPSTAMAALKTLAGVALLVSAVTTFLQNGQEREFPRRRLTMVGDSVPTYMDPLMTELKERKKLFEETPPEEVKYWFEYTGPLQVCFKLSTVLFLVAFHHHCSLYYFLLFSRNTFTAFPSRVAKLITLRDGMIRELLLLVLLKTTWEAPILHLFMRTSLQLPLK